MLSNQQVKFINALSVKKYRQKYGRFIAEGEKIVSELLKSGYPVDAIYALPDWLEQHRQMLKHNISKFIVQEVTEAELKKISQLDSPNKVIAVCPIPETEPQKEVVEQQVCLVLDEIKDPGNLGTIVRTADWFGLPYIFCSPSCVDLYNPKTIQATMGSFLRVKVFYQPLSLLFTQFSDIAVYGAMLNGQNIFDAQCKPPAFVVIGNEARGISDEVLPFIQHSITIPKFGNAESLNAAVATGIICAWCSNQ